MADNIMMESDSFAIKKLGTRLNTHSKISDWHKQESDVMKSLLRLKADKCKPFREKLLHTGDAMLLHSVISRKWGIGIHTTDICHPLDIRTIMGDNLMGKILMELRIQLKRPNESINIQQHLAPQQKNTGVLAPRTQQQPQQPQQFQQQKQVKPMGVISMESKTPGNNINSNKQVDITSAQVILLGSSNTKYVNPNRLFGSKAAKVIKSMTAEETRTNMSSLKPSRTVEAVIIHTGLNDLRNSRPVGCVIDDIQNCLQVASTKFPNANVTFETILWIWRAH